MLTPQHRQRDGFGGPRCDFFPPDPSLSLYWSVNTHYQLSSFQIIFLGQILNNGIPSPSCFLVDCMQGVLSGQASCRANGLVVTLSREKKPGSHDLSASWAPVTQLVEIRPIVEKITNSLTGVLCKPNLSHASVSPFLCTHIHVHSSVSSVLPVLSYGGFLEAGSLVNQNFFLETHFQCSNPLANQSLVIIRVRNYNI